LISNQNCSAIIYLSKVNPMHEDVRLT